MQDNLMTTLKTEFLHARKEKDTFKVGIFSSLIGELESKSKSSAKILVDDSYIIKTIKLYISNIEQYKSKYTGERLTNAIKELEILNSLIPQQLSDIELFEFVNKFDDLPSLMQYMKANYNGLYNGKHLSEMFKNK